MPAQQIFKFLQTAVGCQLYHTVHIHCGTYVCRCRIVGIQFGHRTTDKDDITTQISKPCGYDFKPVYIT